MFDTFNFMAINRCCILGGPYYPTLPYIRLLMKFDENWPFYDRKCGFCSDINMKSQKCYKLLFLQIKAF